MTRRRPWAIAGLALACALTPATASAHALSPSLLSLRESSDGAVEVTWKTPLLRLPGVELRPVLPVDCTVSAPAELTEESDSMTARWRVACPTSGLVGRQIGVEGLGAAKTDALLHVELADGRVIDTVLRAREPTFAVPDREDAIAVARRYVELGVDHIASGYDHLLFVLGLLLLVRGGRALIATITSFTLGHSITLSLAALGLARVASAPVEALIAFSIFLLAVELARSDRGSRLWERPWVMAMMFGFLHGLGFAGALREAGLPQGAIPLALLCFNVGIELGQLAFVAMALVVYRAARALALPIPEWGRTLAVYTIGSLAAFWMIERALPLVGVGWPG
jgi:hypothetical protein